MWRSVSKMLGRGADRHTVTLKILCHPYNQTEAGRVHVGLCTLATSGVEVVLTFLVSPKFPNFPSVSICYFPQQKECECHVFQRIGSNLEREMFCFGIKLTIGQLRFGGWEAWFFLELTEVEMEQIPTWGFTLNNFLSSLKLWNMLHSSAVYRGWWHASLSQVWVCGVGPKEAKNS